MGEYSWGAVAGGGGGLAAAQGTPVNVYVALGASYTVPAGKRLVARLGAVGSNTILSVNGATIALVPGNGSFGPWAAKAGDVVSADTAAFGFSGFLYDA
jgi:hypothetical protein